MTDLVSGLKGDPEPGRDTAVRGRVGCVMCGCRVDALPGCSCLGRAAFPRRRSNRVFERGGTNKEHAPRFLLWGFSQKQRNKRRSATRSGTARPFHLPGGPGQGAHERGRAAQ
jgi:hypothetical protein